MAIKGRLRLDQALVELGLAPSRTKAQQLIAAGDTEVRVGDEWRVVTQASLPVDKSVDSLRLKGQPEILRYVSRGGLKLEGALKDLSLDVTGFRVLDLGLSTGGFADCLLQAGAAAICGVDVGHGQLDARLVGEARLKSFEGVNVKTIPTHTKILDWLKTGVDLCVADLSFISFLGLADVLRGFLPNGTLLLALIKPQFELGAAALNKSGVVADPALYKDLEVRALAAFPGGRFVPSRLKGQDGNQEFFLFSNF